MAKFISFFIFLIFTVYFTILSLIDNKIIDNYLNLHSELRPIIVIVLGIFLLYIGSWFLKAYYLLHVNFKQAHTFDEKKTVRKESYKLSYTLSAYTIGIFILQIFAFLFFSSSITTLVVAFFACLLILLIPNKHTKTLTIDEKILIIKQLPFPINKIILQLTKLNIM